MPKQIHNIQQFHGGLSSNSDPRDIADTELSAATDVMVDEVGKIRLMGAFRSHDAATSTGIQIEAGYGLFQFSHDRINGHLGEHLDETTFATHVNWDVSGDVSDSGVAGQLTFTFASGTLEGYAQQVYGDRLEAGIGGVEYAFTYTVAVTTVPDYFDLKLTNFPVSSTELPFTAGTHTVTFTSHADAATAAFTISATDDQGGTTTQGVFSIDNVSLRIYDPAETGDDYLALADDESSDPAVYIYSKNSDTWSETQTITLGTSDNPKTSFYSVDGAVRISDGNFGANNVNKWWGYIDRTLFKDLTPSYEINQWYEALQEVRKPNSSHFDDNATFPAAYSSSDTTTGSSSADEVHEERTDLLTASLANIVKAEVDWIVEVGGSEEDVTNVTQRIRCGIYTGAFTDTSDIQTVLSGFQEGGTYEGTAIFYFDAADTTTGTSGPEGSWTDFRSEFTSDVGDASHGILAMRLYETGTSALPDLSGTRELSNNNVYMDFDWETNVGASGWNEGGTGKWEVGVSFIYDKLQESQITTCTDVADGTTTAISVPGSDTTSAPNLRVYFADWNTVSEQWNKRISGCNIYMRDVSTSTEKSWFLQMSIDFETGKVLVNSTQKEFDALYHAQANQEYYYFDIGSATGVADESEMLEPSLITTYEVNSGQNALEESIISQYRSAVVVGRRVYIGGLMVEKAIDGSREVMTDAMIKSPVNNFDIFPLSRIVEASVQDGDEIIKLEEYADRILQFKKNKMHLINVSQEIEFLEDTFQHKGVSHPAAVCKTDFGVAWVNRLGCYLYDGQKVHNLLEKGGRQIIKESDWINFTTDNSMIGYLPKKRQLIVTRDNRDTFTLTGSINPTGTNTAVPGSGTIFLTELIVGDRILVTGETRIVDSVTDDTTATVTIAWGSDLANDTSPECLPSGDIFLYDMVTQSWVKGDSALTDDVLKTNFVTDWNGDLVHVHTTGTVLKWDDSSAASTTFEMITKDIDLGQPGQRKKLHRVYVTYKSGATTNVQVDYDVNGGTTFPYDFEDGTNFASTELASASGWQVAELKPDTSSEANNIKSFKLRFATDGTVPLGFEINDISAVYRMKHIK